MRSAGHSISVTPSKQQSTKHWRLNNDPRPTDRPGLRCPDLHSVCGHVYSALSLITQALAYGWRFFNNCIFIHQQSTKQKMRILKGNWELPLKRGVPFRSRFRAFAGTELIPKNSVPFPVPCMFIQHIQCDLRIIIALAFASSVTIQPCS